MPVAVRGFSRQIGTSHPAKRPFLFWSAKLRIFAIQTRSYREKKLSAQFLPI
jgi:hypothetical protein